MKGHNTINCPKEFEPDLLNTFLCHAGLKIQNFTKNVYANKLIRDRDFSLIFKTNIHVSLNIPSK